MGILKKTVTAARESTSLHFPNETEMKPRDSEVVVDNNYRVDTLIDPEDDVGGDTHFENETEYSDKTNKIHATKKATATKHGKAPKHPGKVELAPESKKHHPAKTRANLEDDDPEGLDDPTFPAHPNPNATFPARGPASGTERIERASTKATSKRLVKADGDFETGLQDTQHLSNFDDPAAGYLHVEEEGLQADRGEEGHLPQSVQRANKKHDEHEETASSEEDRERRGKRFHEKKKHREEADFHDEDGSEVALPRGNAPQQGLEVQSDVEIEEFEDQPDEDFIEPGEEEEIEEAVGPEDGEMSILDVDGADDEPDDVVFANVGNSVKVIKANRIIASMSKKIAARAGHEDMYMSEQFAQVTEVEMAKHGVRAGLKKMGFVLATVNLGKAEVLNKRVELKAKKLTAHVRAEAEAQFEVLEQALAIAAVGINKGFFKEQRNELRAALETELEAAGVRGHKKLLANVFATKGIDFAKAILTVAKRVALMGEETRANFVKALDMVGDDLNDDDDLFGNAAAPDFQSQFATHEDEEQEHEADEFADEVHDEGAAPQTIHAALLRPASNIRRNSEVSAKSTGYSVSAAAILSGKAPLPFA
jgi:hypothetical protein